MTRPPTSIPLKGSVDSTAWSFYDKLDLTRRVQRSSDGIWLVTGHPEAVAVLRSGAASSETRRGPVTGRWDGISRRFFMFRDGESHAVLRRATADYFRPVTLRALEKTIEEVVATSLDRVDVTLATGTDTELMREVAHPVAVRTLCSVIGLSPHEEEFVRAWADSLRHVRNDAGFDDRAQSIGNFFGERLQSARASDHAAGLLGEVISRTSCDRLSDEDVVATCVLLVVAGFETTVNFFGNMMLSLLEAPEIFTAMPNNRVALEAAVEELLRLHTPAHIVRRHAAEDIEAAGYSIPAGSDIAILLPLCNRDPRVFSEADRFQFGRSPNPHLSFAFGRHYCVGATLARLELVAMLGAICNRMPALQLSSRSRAGWSGRLLGRGLSEVRVLR